MRELKLAHAESHDLNCLLTTFKEFGDKFPLFYKDKSTGLERIRTTLEFYVRLTCLTDWPTFHANGDRELLSMQQTFIKDNSRRLRELIGLDEGATTTTVKPCPQPNSDSVVPPTAVARNVFKKPAEMLRKKKARGRPPKNRAWDESEHAMPKGGSPSMPKSYVTKVRQMLEAGLFSGSSDVGGVTDEMVNDLVVSRFGELGDHRGRDYRAALHWCQRCW